MAAKVPIRAVFDGTTATGLAEFQSTEFIALAYGGLGASLSIGTAGHANANDLVVSSSHFSYFSFAQKV